MTEREREVERHWLPVSEAACGLGVVTYKRQLIFLLSSFGFCRPPVPHIIREHTCTGKVTRSVLQTVQSHSQTVCYSSVCVCCVLLFRMSWDAYIENLKSPKNNEKSPVEEAAIWGRHPGQESQWVTTPGLSGITVKTRRTRTHDLTLNP